MAGTLRLFEELDHGIPLLTKRIYRFGPKLLVSFEAAQNQEYAYHLFERDDHFFETKGGFPTLQRACNAALVRLKQLVQRDNSQGFGGPLAADGVGGLGGKAGVHQGILPPR